jgi:hypothetical protein
MKVILTRELLVKKKTLTAILFLALLISAAGAFNVKLTQANPIVNVYNDVPPPEGAQAPVITIYTPTNGSSYPNDSTLDFDVTVPRITGDEALDEITKIYYKASWETKEVIVAEKRSGSFSIDLSNVRGGTLSVTIYAVGVGYIETGEDHREENGVLYSYHYFDRFEMTGYSRVNFIKDLIPPKIIILNPQNTTYTSSDVKLDFTVNEATSEILYCLDGKDNQTVLGNVTLTSLENGAHNITLYVSDSAGNAATAKTVSFNVDSADPFPITPVTVSIVTAAIILVGAGLLVYFKKYKH